MKVAGNWHRMVLNNGNICTRQCLCFSVMARTYHATYYTPTSKHSIYLWPGTPHTVTSSQHSSLLHWTVNSDEDQAWSKMQKWKTGVLLFVVQIHWLNSPKCLDAFNLDHNFVYRTMKKFSLKRNISWYTSRRYICRRMLTKMLDSRWKHVFSIYLGQI